MSLPNRKTRLAQSRERTRRAFLWCKRAGITNPKMRAHLCNDLTDAAAAAEATVHHIDALLRANPTRGTGRDRARKSAVEIEVWALIELFDHLKRLKRNWEPTVLDALAARPAKPKAATKAARVRRKSAA